MIVLSWINKEPHLLKTFVVANRISKIQDLTEIAQWHHIASEENPSDLISREDYAIADRWSSSRDDALGNVLLHLVVHISEYEFVKLLLEKGANLASRDLSGRTALHIACEGKSLGSFQLRDRRHTFDIRDRNCRIPLEVACRFHGPEAAQILLSKGKSVFGEGDRPVLLSTLNNSKAYKYAIPMISLLLDAGANIDAADGSGNTALLSALENKAHWRSKRFLHRYLYVFDRPWM
ncbi:B-cell lymphoma 3 protein homolog [Stegodyphus dumicola]|uniref:B-cell lymphoma 3 protein homolog n=1 Tax=Stegodyphus dumicola TaxID=202533 RepID=UPI0015B30827|nr:B-cell lymphoma 3 protein homolog [Stegodyphus dumicola]